MKTYLLCAVLTTLIAIATSKIYERCELGRELYQRFKFPKEDLPTWMCIAYWESRFRTTTVNKNRYDGSTDYGIFQINDKYWCLSERGRSSNLCNMTCDRFLDDDITDDIACVREIMKRQGFSRWVTFRNICYRDSSSYFKDCDLSLSKRTLTLPNLEIPKPGPVGVHVDLSPSETLVQFGGPEGLKGHMRVQPFFTISKFIGDLGLD